MPKLKRKRRIARCTIATMIRKSSASASAKHGMLTALNVVADCLKLPVEKITKKMLKGVDRKLHGHLAPLPLSKDTRSTYITNARRIMVLAGLSFVEPEKPVPAAWEQVASVLTRAAAKRFMARVINKGLTPATLDNDAVWEICADLVRSGLSDHYAKEHKYWFVRHIKEAGLQTLFGDASIFAPPPSKYARTDYPVTLRVQIDHLLAWKQEVMPDGRPDGKGQHRPVTAKTLGAWLARLYGYEIDTLQLTGVNTLADLLDESAVIKFVEWMVRVRTPDFGYFKSHFGMLYAAVRFYPPLRKLGLRFGWLRKLLKRIPKAKEHIRAANRARKYIRYEILESILVKMEEQHAKTTIS